MMSLPGKVLGLFPILRIRCNTGEERSWCHEELAKLSADREGSAILGSKRICVGWAPSGSFRQCRRRERPQVACQAFPFPMLAHGLEVCFGDGVLKLGESSELLGADWRAMSALMALG